MRDLISRREKRQFWKIAWCSVSTQKYHSWMRECGITDWYELENILKLLEQAGLISKFRIIGAAR
jgi:hypothetical protein